MKTAEELRETMPSMVLSSHAAQLKWIESIQLDAFKAGERFAAEIAKKGVPASTLPSGKVITYYKDKHIYEAILTDANNRTELP